MGRLYCDFRQGKPATNLYVYIASRYISETVQDRDIVIMER